MAIFHAAMKVFSRSKGHSATAAAAYRAGSKITDDRTGLVHDYTRRRGEEGVRLYAPKDAPAWATDAARLWNAAEAADGRVNSRVARELEVALPSEFDAEQRRALVDELGQMLVERHQVAVMAAIHAPDQGGDARNYHVHFLFTVRTVGAEGFEAKTRVLDDQKTGPLAVEALRSRVAELTNLHLTRAGIGERVDHRRLEVQAQEAANRGDVQAVAQLARAPTQHEGKAATAAKRDGCQTERATTNQAIRQDNQGLFSEFLAQTAQAPDQIRMPCAPSTSSASPRLRLGAGRVRLQRGTGAGAGVLNAQAQQVEESIRAEQANAQAYVDGLNHEREATKALATKYARAMGWPRRETRLLRQRCTDDVAQVRLLRRGLQAKQRMVQIETEDLQRRKAYGMAMVATGVARKALEAFDAPPPSWKPFSRRQWAERRRAQRAVVEATETAERRLARSDYPSANQALGELQAVAALVRTTFRLDESPTLAIDAALPTFALTPELEPPPENVPPLPVSRPRLRL